MGSKHMIMKGFEELVYTAIHKQSTGRSTRVIHNDVDGAMVVHMVIHRIGKPLTIPGVGHKHVVDLAQRRG